MAIQIETGATLPFDRFWDWLMDHPNCVLSVRSDDAWLFDDDALHWAFFAEEQGTPVVNLLLGKRTVGEMVLDTSDVLHVQVALDPENVERGFHLFQVMGGPRSAPRVRYTFQLAHGFDSVPRHDGLKH